MSTAILHVHDEQTVEELPAEYVTRESKQRTGDTDYFIVDLHPAVQAEELHGQQVRVHFEDETELTINNSDLVGFV